MNFCKAVGMKQEEIDYYKEMQEIIAYMGEGDKWVSEITAGETTTKHQYTLGVKNPPQKGPDGSTFTIEPKLVNPETLEEISVTQLPGHDKEVVTKTVRILTAPNKMKSIVTDVASGVSMTFYTTKQ